MSTINVTNLSGRGGGTPNLPDGAVISGVATVTNLKPTNVNVSGAVTATTFDGSLKSTGTPTLGLGVTINASGVNVSGVLTATTYYGDGSNLAGVGESIAPWHYNPDVNDTLATVDTGIGITFNKKIVAGSGTATLKIVNAGTAGTTIQSWGVSSCTFDTTVFTFGSLVSNLSINQTYQVDIPGTFIDDAGGNSYAGTAYTFSTQSSINKLWVWGSNSSGALGQNQAPAQLAAVSSPVQIPGNTWVNPPNGYVGPSLAAQYAIKEDGTLWSWGYNGQGNLALNDNVKRSSPAQVPGTTWSTVVSTAYASLATKTDGTLWGMGYNANGTLGQNNTTGYSSPKQIPGTTWGTTVGKLSGGFQHGLAIKTDGTLWSWGLNEQGQLGVNNRTHYSSPVQIPGTTWASVPQGNGHGTSYAIKTDGTLWAWGISSDGALGQNQPNSTRVSSPVQIPGTTWANVEAGQYQVIATKTDGTLWTWGQNDEGDLGQNNLAAQSSPIQVGGGTDWSTGVNKMFAYATKHGAIKTDGTLWVWGANENGALGLNQAVALNISSPTQIPGTEWSKISFMSAIQDDQTP